MVKFETKTVKVNHPNDVVNFSLKLNKQSSLFAGCIATVTTAAALSDTKTLCNAGFQFASKKFPVLIPSDNKRIDQIKKYKIFDTIHEIAVNTNIEGFINDLGVSDNYPYTVCIACKIIEHD